jgi:hypothetical protein
MKQRMRKKPLYRRLRKAKLALLLRLIKKIAASLPAEPVNPDEYHKFEPHADKPAATPRYSEIACQPFVFLDLASEPKR